MTKKLFLLTVALLCAVVQGAWANDPIKYIERSWDGSKVVETEKTITDYTLLEGDHSSDLMNISGTYVVKGDVKYQTLNVWGTSSIILLDDATLTCTGGIRVGVGSMEPDLLRIYSQSDGEHQGKLIVTNSNEDAAGIGSTKAQTCGSIEIYGGNIDVTGGKFGAGIGGGGFDYSFNKDNELCATKATDGTTTIYGGIVKAQGGGGGAGIGGGALADGGRYYQYGGEVTAIGGNCASGVGGGGECTCIDYSEYKEYTINGGNAGQIHIYGGKLTAQGGNKGAGIGSGDKPEKLDISTSGELWVYSGATVIATGGKYGAGIGGGMKAAGMVVHISGGDVKAYGGEDAAGIGGGEAGNGGITHISGGTVLAQGKSYGSGIGSGEDTWRAGSPVGGETYITGGTVIAIAGEDCKAREASCGSAIGCGDGVSNKDAADKLKIIEIADNMRVTGGDSEDNIERVFTATERIGACIWRNYVKIEPCDHTAPTVGSDRRTIDITSMDADQHTIRCHYCSQTWTGAHYYPAEDPSTCSDCGYVQYDENAAQIIVTLWFMDGKYLNELGAYSTAPGPNGRAGQRIVLPTPSIEGLQFMGYLKTPASLPSDVIMQPDEDEATLLKGGEVYTLNTDDAYDEWGTKKTNLFARYIYDFTEKWEWAEDYSSVKLTLSNKFLDDVVLTSEDGQIQLTSEEIKDKYDVTRAMKHVATVTYQTTENGHIYTFSSETKEKYELVLANNADNSQAIKNLNGKKVPILMDGRTFYTDGYWNTICLPFDVDEYDIEWFEFYEIKTLSSSSFDAKTGTLTLNFVDSETIEAGKPYLVRWDEDVDNWQDEEDELHTLSNLEFEPAVIDNTLRPVMSSYVDFVGSFSPVSLTEGDKSVLYLGADNKLYYPSADMTVGSCRAVFRLKDITAGDLASGANARRFVLNFGDGDETTGIISIDNGQLIIDNSMDAWYTLDGRRLTGKPTAKGLYINNGRKVVIK